MWHTQTAAVTGSGHRSKQLPCQDKTWCLEANGVTAIALADGAGSAALSQEGAEIAVRMICRTLCERFDELYAAKSPVEMRVLALQGIRERIRSHAMAREASVSSFACTLLAVAVRGNDYLLIHVGDGVIGYQKNGRVLVASGPQNGEYANTTSFVTSRDVYRTAHVLRGVQPELEGFLLMSDGCEAALYQKQRASIAPLAKRLFQRAELLDQHAAEALLQEVLERFIALHTRDDCSLAVMARERTSWDRLTQREKAAVLGIGTQKKSRRRRMILKYAKLLGAA